MATLNQCDRCKATWVNRPLHRLYPDDSDRAVLELCDGCHIALRSWLDDPKRPALDMDTDR